MIHECSVVGCINPGIDDTTSSFRFQRTKWMMARLMLVSQPAKRPNLPHISRFRGKLESARRKKARDAERFLPTFRWIPKKKNRCAVSVRGRHETNPNPIVERTRSFLPCTCSGASDRAAGAHGLGDNKSTTSYQAALHHQRVQVLFMVF